MPPFSLGLPPPRRTRRWPCSRPLPSVTRTGRHSSSPEKIIGTVASTRPSATLLPSTNRVAVPPLPSPCRAVTTRCRRIHLRRPHSFPTRLLQFERVPAGHLRGGRSVHAGCPRFGPAPLQKRSWTTKSGRISSQSSTARCNVGLSSGRIATEPDDNDRSSCCHQRTPRAMAKSGDHSMGPTRRAPLVDDATPPAASRVITRASRSPAAANGSIAGRLPTTPSEITSPSP